MSKGVVSMSMGESSPIVVYLVILLFCSLPLTSITSGHHLEEVDSSLIISQPNGTHFSDNITVNGTTSLSPVESVWELWNVGDGTSSWSLQDSGSHFTTVVPQSDDLWNWSLIIDIEGVDCTCLLTISIPNGLDPMTKSIIVYLGDSGHRPMILDVNYVTTIIVEQPVVMEIDYVLPYIVNTGVTLFAQICEAPYSVCLQTPYPLTINQSDDNNGTLTLIFAANELALADGIYQLDFHLSDALLLNSNSETLAIVVDTQQPIVELSGPDNSTESQQVFISALVDDGYSGSTENLVWTIKTPDGKVRSPSNDEVQDIYSLQLIPDLAGNWTIDLLVRDVGGHFVTTSHSFSVVNIAPQAHLTLDGFEVQNGSLLTPANPDNWILDSSASTDTSDDMQSLQYDWYVDGTVILSGENTFSQEDYPISGHQEVLLIVSDDDGIKSEVHFTIYVEEKVAKSNTSSVIIGLIVLSLAIVALVMLRSTQKENEKISNSKSIPKWGEKKKSTTLQVEDEESEHNADENSIWQDEAFAGKSQ